MLNLWCFLSTREKLEDNLVNAMETIDSEPGTSQSADSKPALMFKIASKRKRWRSLQLVLPEPRSPENPDWFNASSR